MSVRVRFAPSPTGSLHLGSARTALYNWLTARAAGEDGTYILRIEDTDRERSTTENVDQALRIFRWMGLDWDEGPDVGGDYGPYFQSERADLYREHADQLLASGHAYECYCTPDEISAARAAAEAARKPLVYNGACRDLSDAERAARRDEGRPVSLRFRVPADGLTVVDDMISGRSEFQNELLGDFIIVRSSGDAMYNFACAVDDATMQITHVIRGVDHLSNTPRQVLMLEAMGYDIPAYAHAPMILGPDKKKLSKRHGAASVEELEAAGYLPAGVRNAVALVGWNRDDDTTLMTTEEMVAAFDPAAVRSSPAVIDYKRMDWINGQHLRAMDPADFGRVWEEWRDRWLDARLDASSSAHAAALALDADQAPVLVQQKVTRLDEIPELVAFLADGGIADDAWDVLRAVDPAPEVLTAAAAALRDVEPWTPAAIEERIRQLVQELDLKPKFIFNPIRLAVTGQKVSPGLFESAWALGRDRAVANVTDALKRIGAERATA